MSKFLTLQKNNKGGIDYWVGDIHGCYSLLEKALENVGFDKTKDRLFVLGDLVDRGPESHRAIEFLEQPWFISLQGNHDAFVCKTAELLLKDDDKDAYNNSDFNTCISNGGMWVIGQPPQVLKEIVRSFSQLPLAIEYVDEQGNALLGMVHAEVPHDCTWDEFKYELQAMPHDYVYSIHDDSSDAVTSAVWGRSKISTFEGQGKPENSNHLSTPGIPAVICGHNIVFVQNKGAVNIGNNRLIDHGICKRGEVHLYTLEDLIN